MSDQENWLKSKRLRRAWSQEQLAEISGLSVRTVQRIEQGGTASLDTLKAIACAFDTDVSLLQNSVSNTTPTVEVTSTVSAEQQPMSSLHKREDRIEQFHRHLIIYLLVNLGLFIVDITTSSDSLWFYYPLFFWGIPLSLRGLHAYGFLKRRKPELVH
jgi:transcriptional regulator with XRE-family HTH domain